MIVIHSYAVSLTFRATPSQPRPTPRFLLHARLFLSLIPQNISLRKEEKHDTSGFTHCPVPATPPACSCCCCDSRYPRLWNRSGQVTSFLLPVQVPVVRKLVLTVRGG